MDTASGRKLLSTVPRPAMADRKNRVADTNPKENTRSSRAFRSSSMIFPVRTLPQNTMVMGFDKVSTNPCKNTLAESTCKLRPGSRLFPKAPSRVFRPNRISTAPPI